jgi:hypothetical protein
VELTLTVQSSSSQAFVTWSTMCAGRSNKAPQDPGLDYTIPIHPLTTTYLDCPVILLPGISDVERHVRRQLKPQHAVKNAVTLTTL